jgi:hypothetical protein
MGAVCASPDDYRNIVVTIPYQVAQRKEAEVSSRSPYVFEKMFQTGNFRKICDYHSHPCCPWEKHALLEPSSTDLKQIQVGGIELIVKVVRTKKNANYWRSNGYAIFVAWGKFRFEISVFQRLKDQSKKVLLYKTLRIGLKRGRHGRRVVKR